MLIFYIFRKRFFPKITCDPVGWYVKCYAVMKWKILVRIFHKHCKIRGNILHDFPEYLREMQFMAKYLENSLYMLD